MTAPHQNTPPRSYRDYLEKRGRAPLKIERTNKRAGSIVLGNSAMPARVVEGRKGSFRGYGA